MPLAQYPSSQLFVWFDDRYGISWQLELSKSASGGASALPAGSTGRSPG
jgi:predicted 3-demethylubiquinone-9 3-methyltransferase (glyoxalase superfamily)